MIGGLIGVVLGLLVVIVVVVGSNRDTPTLSTTPRAMPPRATSPPATTTKGNRLSPR